MLQFYFVASRRHNTPEMNSSALAVFHITPADPLLDKNYPLFSSPWPITIILSSYLLFVLKVGKQFMEHRKPYNMKNFILSYNICQMIYNALMFCTGIYYLIIKPAYDLKCIETLSLDHPEKHVERWCTYAFYVNKIFDLVETIIFVLRKSYKQITFLHVYHHVSMVYITYWVARLYGVGGQYVVMGALNSFVHTVMYFYYFISAVYPELRGSLWWKRYITEIQIVQFIILELQALWVLLFNPGCKFPLLMQFMQLFQATAMIYMFSKFYIKAYIKPKKLKEN